MRFLHRSLRAFALLAILLLAACQPGTAVSGPVTAQPSQTATITAPPPASASATAAWTLTATVSPTPAARVERVLILSVDGLRPEAIAMAPMPNLIALMESGAATRSAQTVIPSATLPAHAAMLVGSCPQDLGVDWNDYLPERGIVAGTDLFDLVHDAGMTTIMFVGKEKLGQLTEPESLDVFRFINDRDSVIIDQLIEQLPADFGLLFVHFPTADWMGHVYGWLAGEQLSVLYRGDQAFGRLLAALDEAGLLAGTLIIVTADHGGHGTTHGSTLAEDMTIPWIIAGPGVVPGQLTAPVHITDTAATAAWALGLSIPPEWDGVPVTEAFGLAPLPRVEVVCP
ncbi:MAG: alkaline phosphatase family protein [Chloroflexota bacterium]